MKEIAIIPVTYLAIRMVIDAIAQAIDTKGREWKPLAAIALGLAIAFGGPVDVTALLIPDFAVSAWVGQALTGCALAGGASFLSDVVKRWQGTATVEIDTAGLEEEIDRIVTAAQDGQPQ